MESLEAEFNSILKDVISEASGQKVEECEEENEDEEHGPGQHGGGEEHEEGEEKSEGAGKGPPGELRLRRRRAVDC